MSNHCGCVGVVWGIWLRRAECPVEAECAVARGEWLSLNKEIWCVVCGGWRNQVGLPCA